MHTTQVSESLKYSEFSRIVDELRHENKGRWYALRCDVAGHAVELKAFGTWLQIYKVDGVDCSAPMDISVGAFKLALAKPFHKFFTDLMGL